MKEKITQRLLELFAERGMQVKESDLVDFNIQGNESDETLKEWVSDWFNEEHTIRQENKNSWMYEI